MKLLLLIISTCYIFAHHQCNSADVAGSVGASVDANLNVDPNNDNVGGDKGPNEKPAMKPEDLDKRRKFMKGVTADMIMKIEEQCKAVEKKAEETKQPPAAGRRKRSVNIEGHEESCPILLQKLSECKAEREPESGCLRSGKQCAGRLAKMAREWAKNSEDRGMLDRISGRDVLQFKNYCENNLCEDKKKDESGKRGRRGADGMDAHREHCSMTLVIFAGCMKMGVDENVCAHEVAQSYKKMRKYQEKVTKLAATTAEDVGKFRGMCAATQRGGLCTGGKSFEAECKAIENYTNEEAATYVQKNAGELILKAYLKSNICGAK